MKKTVLIGIAILISGAAFSMAATIPAGTILIARTVEPISSHESPGAPFKADLEQAVAINGKVLLPAGTRVTGVVVTSARSMGTSSALTLNLKAISVNGRNVPVQTTGAFRLDRHKTKRGVSVSGREWNFPYQTRIAFKLAQPVNL